ncbi:transcriptional regulator Regulator of drug sensitivity (RDS2) [Scheffersomyces stipitis CBS 6054]|uniref:Transcription activator of gluconeogenesis ERT1 n=1 Tax=Scheffersomyces stipitis (strain ATCC 58785 / CBS 6054 / NBRC 10063 / NRRL Y-11545) TaxID=322104 RepID=ERT1_PICST|nr:transcriptional regulator Regulator of drug sensitivity (RDS2) [Scheffersomyces stipitis CBS 6054]A3LQV7.2 RecName: Full=Transcription activator of gluconeogenesis ERT1 [Scheffersomyces stipitis CBS 6054]ABN65276.2 transcriptional regulator Regulator of drug sensitivity (RDS2) [Scheffersomyces stipitis CBS 6054]
MSSDESERTVSVKQEDDSLRPKRKKTNRACNHCHKAHMTCDSGRPCKRCIQRGLDKTCEDARRKRKKYLADVPNTALLPNRLQQAETYDGTNASPTESGRSIMYQATTFQHSSTVPISYTNSINDDIYSLGFSKSHNSFLPRNQNQTQPLARSQSTFSQKQSTLPQTHSNLSSSRRTNFLSSAADLEYSTLSSILQDNFMHGNHSTSNEGTPNSITLSPALSPHALTTTVSSNTNTGTATRNMTTPDDLNYTSKRNKPYVAGSSQTPSPQDQLSNGSMEAKARISNASASIYDHQRYPKCDESINQYFLGPTESDQVSMFPDVITAIETMKASDPSVFYERNSKSALSFTIGIVPDDNHYTKNHDSVENESFYKEPEEIYAKVKKPFSYTPGYHSLIAYLRKRFNKPMLVKMAESMAAYRPSFIACTNSLKEGDLIFMEQCFQRTLLTYDNFIRVSGTPTIVWRRTGEIAYVGNEFCILTGWSKEELLGKQRKFIVELLDDKSVLEYFQLFSRIAFGDFLGATMTECTLLTPKTDVKIRTGCMWTLKRDVFGIPMMIVGNFLPIL